MFNPRQTDLVFSATTACVGRWLARNLLTAFALVLILPLLHQGTSNSILAWPPEECSALINCDHTEDQKLTASDAASYDEYGSSVSVSGDTAVVGAHNSDCADGNSCGSAYVYRFDGSNWVEEAILTASDADRGDYFGGSVSVSGDTAIVGAQGSYCGTGIYCGAAYVYRFDGSSWVEEAKLPASDTAPGDWFGHSVSISGNTAVVGAFGDDCASGNMCGSAYVYRFDGSSWVEEAKLTAPDREEEALFGWSVSVSGDTAFVSVVRDGCESPHACGAAYVYRFDGSGWVEEAKLTASDAAWSDTFGTSVFVSGDTAIVGADRDDCAAGYTCGSAYVYRFDGSIWVEEIKLTASDAAAGDGLGTSVSVSGDTAVVGAFGHFCATGGNCGATYVYRFDGSNWVEEAKLTASAPAAEALSGLSVSVSGNTVVVGVLRDNCAAGEDCGAAYVFELNADDCNCNTIADPCEMNDCNKNCIEDADDIANLTSWDCNSNDTPDECELFENDCNINDVPDDCDLLDNDCNSNDTPDECDLFENDCNTNGVPDECEIFNNDCNENGVHDACELFENDCNESGVPDECEMIDCNENCIDDADDILNLTSPDCNTNGVPDECELLDNDCNDSGVPDECELVDNDCNSNGTPDECEIDVDSAAPGGPFFCDPPPPPAAPEWCAIDCNGSGIPDDCELVNNDCNTDGIPDECELSNNDCNGSGVPDECEMSDCNDNCIDDADDIFNLTSPDCDGSGVPDECELFEHDCNGSGVLDICELVDNDCNDDGRPDECGAIIGCDGTQDHKLTASESVAENHLGSSVSVSGDTAVVGASGDDCAGGSGCGSAYVYRFDGWGWVEEAKLTASDAAADNNFGNSVSVSGDTAVVGALYADCADGEYCGSAYVFRYDGSNWVEEAKLTASDATRFNSFGVSVSVSGSRIVVGANANRCATGFFCGAAYVYRFDGSSWVEEAKLSASDAAYNDGFGDSVSFSADRILVGVTGDDCTAGDNCGAAYVFRFTGSIWVEEAKLTASDAAASDYLGRSVSISGDTAVVSALGDDCAAGTRCGSAYVYRFDGTGWVEEAKLTASDPAVDRAFGSSVSVSGDTAVVGAIFDACAAGTHCGSAYVYHFDGSSWVEDARLTASDAAADDLFGSSDSVSVSGDTAIVGAYRSDCAAGIDCGAAYVFDLSDDDCDCNTVADSCEMNDCNKNCIEDVDDIADLTSPDCNANGVPDECELYDNDCNTNDVPDDCELLDNDCNESGVPDECELIESDCNGNGVPDECEMIDCNENCIDDAIDIANLTSPDCNGSGVPDECELLDNDCNDSGVPDECEMIDCNENCIDDADDIANLDSPDCDANGVPDECDLVESDCNDNGILDECECFAVDAPLAEPGGAAKNRYVSLNLAGVSCGVALRMTFVDLPGAYAAYNGMQMWVGPPVEVSENAGKIDPAEAPGFPTFWAATLQCDPYYTSWSALPVVYIYDEAIVPTGVYDIQTIAPACEEATESNLSAPLTVIQSQWGDVVSECSTTPCGPPDGVINVTSDVTAILNKFKNLVGAPIKARTDLDFNLPDQKINISDVTQSLDAFRGFDYPFDPGAPPPPCP